MDLNPHQNRNYDPRYRAPTQGGQFATPPQQSFNDPDFEGSVQKVLTENVGQYVVMEFLIGTESIVRKQGILYFVGVGYVVLYDDVIDNFIVCDLYSIKFTYFYYPGQRPNQNFNAIPPAHTMPN
ncbi:MAG: hypothetical protein IKD18_07020 [Clostridia bacterium]|nr:hypothetical protein [Clostridia bacterium]